MKHKTVSIEVVEKRDDGGRILISTGAYDRDNDRLFPDGAKTDNYTKNPVVQYGHNYEDPWATVGKTNRLEITDNGIISDFDLRPAANEHDPQNIVRLLWKGDWIRTASVGFNPNMEKAVKNDRGGFDFPEWELLEWSLVPVPANQEALRLAVKGLGSDATQSLESIDYHINGTHKQIDEQGGDAIPDAVVEESTIIELELEIEDTEAAELETDDELSDIETLDTGATDDNELTPEQETALLEALHNLRPIIEIIGETI